MKEQLKALGAWFGKAGNTNFVLAGAWLLLFLIFGVGQHNKFLMALDGFMVVFNLGLGLHARRADARLKAFLQRYDEIVKEKIKGLEEKL